MAKSKSDEEEGKKSSPIKKLAVPIALLAGVVVGPKVIGGDSGGDASAATTTTTHAPAPITLEQTTVNLADGALLRFGLALQPSAEWAEAHEAIGEEAEDDDTDTTAEYAPALDAAVRVFTSRTREQLFATGGRESAKAELLALLETTYEGRFEDIYLYSFVAQ